MKTSLSYALRHESTFREFARWGDIPDCKKYKELLDIGAITQEEYDAVKAKILGL